jgi:DNA helicase-2/ATP-dependent DNA helicase PcrA
LTSRRHLDLEKELNPEQLVAATHGEGPQLVLAGAGSGKTRVITYRIAWLLEQQGVAPDAVAAVTFTNKAAKEMQERVEALVARHPLPTFLGTFHRYALKLLRRYGDRIHLRRDFVILDTQDQRTLMGQALEREGLSEKAYPVRAVLAAVSSAKNRLENPQAYGDRAQNFFEKRVAALYRRYQHLASRIGGVDFDDMIFLSVRLLEEDAGLLERLRSRLRYLLVDEYQDTNHAQLRLIRALAGDNGNLTAVGDEDQGIYRWRGADLNNILEFEETFPQAVERKLEQNYRSTQTILDASGALVARNRGRRGKRLWTERGEGELIELYKAGDEADEARWVAAALEELKGAYSLGQMAILVRTNSQTRALEDEFLRRGLPYELVAGVRFYDRAEIKDLVAYLHLLRNPHNDLALRRVLNQPPRGIGKNTQELLQGRARDLGVPLWDALAKDDLGTFPSRAAKALAAFRDLIHSLRQLAERVPMPSLLDQLLEATGYLGLYSQDDPDGQARLENIREFLSAAQEFTETHSYLSEEEDLLAAFLDRVALVSDLDGWKGGEAISVMTLHSAKGLEFPVVAVCGLEDGLLPHFNAKGSAEELEEERRLLYVGMTRAKDRLLLSSCRRRRVAGTYQDREPSPFLEEIPGQFLKISESPSLFPDGRGAQIHQFFGRPASGSAAGGRRRVIEGLEDDSPLRRGVRVRHPSLGSGQVLDLEGAGDAMKVEIYFERVGKRKLIARYANLEILGP